MEGTTGFSPAVSPASQQAQPTAMQNLLSELDSLTAVARANLSAVASQRGRLIGDLPPEPPTAQNAEKQTLSGGSVSFGDIAAALGRLDSALRATNEHVVAMKKIG